MKESKDKARVPILAAGGIVLRGRGEPEIALVQLRKMGAWVLPRGKLAPGESAIAAARREVVEETGQRVSVHEFLGTLAYETGGRQKIIRFWRMQALGGPIGELMQERRAALPPGAGAASGSDRGARAGRFGGTVPGR
jgi:8-oxo-dGTP diphosphatase